MYLGKSDLSSVHVYSYVHLTRYQKNLAMFNWSQLSQPVDPRRIYLSIYLSTMILHRELQYIESTLEIYRGDAMLTGVFQGGGGNFSKRVVPIYIMMILTQFTLNGQGRTVRFGRRGQILRSRPGEISPPLPLLVL